MVAKCNITNLALQTLSKLKWGFSCEDAGCEIIANYIQYLQNEGIEYSVSGDCTNDDIIFNCNFNIVSISATLNPITDINADVIFDIKLENYAGGTLPFTYKWIYDTTDFDIIGEDTDPQIKLKLKADKLIELVVTKIQVEITEADGCKDIKFCWLTPEGMQCNINFAPCRNPSNLEVSYEYVSCAKPKSLTVTSN